MKAATRVFLCCMALLIFALPVSAKTTIVVSAGSPEFREEFMKRHPHIQVEDAGEWIGKDQFITRAVGGNPVHVFACAASWVRPLVEQDLLADLTPYIERSPEFDYQDFLPVSREPFTYENRVYGIPYDCGAVLNYYDKSAFAAGGLIEPKHLEWTLDEYLSAAKKLTIRDSEDEITRYGADGVWLWWLNAPGLASFGATLYNPTTKTVLDPPETAAKALEWWSDLVLTHEVAKPDWGNFYRGEAAMGFAGSWELPHALQVFAKGKDALGVRTVPKGPAGRFTTLAGSALSIVATDDLEVRNAAWLYVSEWLGVEEMKKRGGLESMPRLSALELWGEPYGELGLQARQAVTEAAENGIFNPVLPPDVNSAVWHLLNQVISGEIPARTAVTLAREQAEALLQ